jgi:hypothetical protein
MKWSSCSPPVGQRLLGYLDMTPVKASPTRDPIALKSSSQCEALAVMHAQDSRSTCPPPGMMLVAVQRLPLPVARS